MQQKFLNGSSLLKVVRKDFCGNLIIQVLYYCAWIITSAVYLVNIEVDFFQRAYDFLKSKQINKPIIISNLIQFLHWGYRKNLMRCGKRWNQNSLKGIELFFENSNEEHWTKMKFFIKSFFSKCNQIQRKLRIWSHLLKKSLMENVVFCAVGDMWNKMGEGRRVNNSNYGKKTFTA